MNKSEFIDAVAERSDLSKAAASRTLDSMVEVIAEAMREGDQVTLVGFGTFLMRHREARKGRNPRTGEEIEIAASNTPSFKPGKALKDAVN